MTNTRRMLSVIPMYNYRSPCLATICRMIYKNINLSQQKHSKKQTNRNKQKKKYQFKLLFYSNGAFVWNMCFVCYLSNHFNATLQQPRSCGYRMKDPWILISQRRYVPKRPFIKPLNNPVSRTPRKILHLEDYVVRTVLRLDGNRFNMKMSSHPHRDLHYLMRPSYVCQSL